MADKKVKVSNILSSIMPGYVVSESPLFQEFLEQYYHFDVEQFPLNHIRDTPFYIAPGPATYQHFY